MRSTWTVVLAAVAVAAMLGGCGQAGPAKVAGLEGWWPMDEGAGLAVKNRAGTNDGQIMEGLKWTDGKVGKVVAFDGNGYVVIPSAGYLNTPQYTFTAWIKLKDTSNYQYVVWRGGPEFPEPKEARSLDMWVTMEGTLSGIVDYRKEGEGRLTITGAKKVTDNQWHLVACVNDGKTLCFYVDGKKDAEEKLAGPLAVSDFPLWIGARPGQVAATGVIDEVRFFSRALSEAEVAALK